MSQTACFDQLNLFSVGKQQVTVDFNGGNIVSDAGLLPIAQLINGLGILDDLAERFPDPRDPQGVVHSVKQILAQQIYQFLAGYFDFDDANFTRHDPLFQTLVGVSPGEQQPLASGSTIARFHHAYTRREAGKPVEDRDVLLEQRQAQIDRIQQANEYLIELFAKTRTQTPTHVILDLDGSEDAAHGQQQLSFWNAHYGQNQYYPLFVLDGVSGFPLAAWLRPGNVHDSCGAVEILQDIVRLLRKYFPDLVIFVRGDGAFGGPEMLDFCEREGLWYALGYRNHRGVKPQTNWLLEQLELYHRFYPEPGVQRFDAVDYQASTWSRSRRLIVKTEINFIGSNQRLIVSNLEGTPREIYKEFYAQRGNVPERPIGEMKNGLGSDRLSSGRFLANAQKLLCHVLAYALVVLFREACRTTAAEWTSPDEVGEEPAVDFASQIAGPRLSSTEKQTPISVRVGGPSVPIARLETARVSLGGVSLAGNQQPVEEIPYDSSSDPRPSSASASTSTPATNQASLSEPAEASEPTLANGWESAAAAPKESPPRLTREGLAALTAKRRILLEVSKWEVSTLRERLFKVGALVKTSVRRIWFHLSTHWPGREYFQVVSESLGKFLASLQQRAVMTTGPPQ